ncbi:M55 family metallopeptidase [Streptomyces pharetrae]|uniref:M55 family metallopeptidase n=2 Tax=Streptomyces pharetrae TaxID=291370 RepID=UPI0036612301
MKILISADMEGATGVTWPADVLPGTPQWERCRTLFTSDVQAAALGFFDGGADRVLVNEAHWTMRNLLLERLDDRVEMLTGRHKSLSMVEGVQHGDVDGIAFVGYHAGAGMEGVLAHTYLANSITGVWLNDVRASEGLLNAHVVAEYGVPVVLVTGDDVACEDALGYAPEALKVAVKDHVSRYAAVCRTPARTAADIRAAAKEAVALAGRRDPMAGRPHTAGGPGADGGLHAVDGPGGSGGPRTAGGPVVAGGPYTVAVEFDAEHLAMAATVVPGVDRIGERKVAYTSPTMYEGIRTFKAVTTVVSAAVEEQYG